MKEYIDYLEDSFTDYAGKVHYFVIAAIITTICVHMGVDSTVFQPIKELSKFMIIMAMAIVIIVDITVATTDILSIIPSL